MKVKFALTIVIYMHFSFMLLIAAPPVNLIEPPPVETRTAAYGMTVLMDCKTDLEPPVKYLWSKQGGELPRDARGEKEVINLFFFLNVILI